jgi:hypothetical protein
MCYCITVSAVTVVTIAGCDGRLVIATTDGEALHTSGPHQGEKEGVATIHHSKNNLRQRERERERERRGGG